MVIPSCSRLGSAGGALLLLWHLSGLAGAAVVDDVAHDFAPATGVVLGTEGGEVLVDLDAADGAMAGDLLAAVQPGEAVVHPTTGAVLGHRDRVLGVLRITRVRSGYSETSRLDTGAPLPPGTPVRRFQNLPAVFVDRTGTGRPLYERLTEALPTLEWQGYRVASDEAPEPSATIGLVFELDDDGLQVRDTTGRTLHRYPRPEAATIPAPAPPAREATSPAPQVVASPPAAPGRRTRLPSLVRLGAFQAVGDRLLLAATDGTAVQVFDVTDGPRTVAEYRPPEGGTVIGVHWWWPDRDKEPYVVATAWEDRSALREPSLLRGRVLRWQGGRLVAAAEDIPYILGSFDVDGDGVKELLLGESFDRETFFGPTFHEVRLVDAKLETLPPPLDLPRGFRVQGSAIGDLDGDGHPEILLLRGGVLAVFRGGEEIFRSAKDLGGSLHHVLYTVNPEAQNQLHRTAVFEVDPVVGDLDGDGRPEVLVAATEHASLLSLGSGTSALAMFTLEGGTLTRETVGSPFESPVQALGERAGTLLVVATRVGGPFSGPGESDLVATPMPR